MRHYHPLMSVYFGVLFFILMPGFLFRFPTKGSTLMVAGVHATLFAILHFLTHKIAWKFFYGDHKHGRKKRCPHRCIHHN